MTQTTKARHTPGPWHVSGDTINGPEGTLVAGVPHPHNLPKREANARLISAAPDLLEAVQKFVTYYGAGNKAPMLGNGQARRSLDEFAAAIRKATGGEGE